MTSTSATPVSLETERRENAEEIAPVSLGRSRAMAPPSSAKKTSVAPKPRWSAGPHKLKDEFITNGQLKLVPVLKASSRASPVPESGAAPKAIARRQSVSAAGPVVKGACETGSAQSPRPRRSSVTARRRSSARSSTTSGQERERERDARHSATGTLAGRQPRGSEPVIVRRHSDGKRHGSKGASDVDSTSLSHRARFSAPSESSVARGILTAQRAMTKRLSGCRQEPTASTRALHGQTHARSTRRLP